jgi:hypothetical protein
MKEILQQIAGIIGIFCYIPLIIGIIKNRIAQSFVAFALWAMLDLIATLESLLLVAASQQLPFLSGRSLHNHQHALLVCNPSSAFLCQISLASELLDPPLDINLWP